MLNDSPPRNAILKPSVLISSKNLAVAGTFVHLMISPMISLNAFLVNNALTKPTSFGTNWLKITRPTVVSINLNVNEPSGLRKFALTLMFA